MIYTKSSSKAELLYYFTLSGQAFFAVTKKESKTQFYSFSFISSVKSSAASATNSTQGLFL